MTGTTEQNTRSLRAEANVADARRLEQAVHIIARRWVWLDPTDLKELADEAERVAAMLTPTTTGGA